MYYLLNKDQLVIPEFVIFDFDCTLCDSWPLLIKTWNTFLIEQGMQAMTEQEIFLLPHLPQADLIKQIFGENCDDIVKKYWDIYKETHKDPPPLIESVARLLNVFNDHKIYMSIVTNGNGESVREHCKKLRVDKYFSKIIGMGDTSYCKPNPKIIDEALPQPRHELNNYSESNFIDHKIWYIGDSPNDILTAKNANVLPVWVTDKATQQVEIIFNEYTPGAYPLLKINTLAELYKL